VSPLELERAGNATIARPTTDIDASNALDIREQLTDRLAGSLDHLVIDLSQVRYIDSAGLDMLFRLGERLRQRRARLMLVIPAESQLLRLARIVGLPRAMGVFESVEEAAGSCEAKPEGEARCMASEASGEE
jgi:anti-sigma B factor antagonist